MTKLTGERLRNLRMICGCNREEFGAKLGYDPQHLGRFERGEARIPDHLIYRLREILTEHAATVNDAMKTLRD